MDRRSFIRKNSQISLLAPLIPFSLDSLAVLAGQDKKPGWLIQMIANNDEAVERIQLRYVADPSSPFFGAILDTYGMATPHAATSFLKTGICSLISPESRFYQDEALVEKLSHSAAFLLHLQHEDGTIDLLSTNFHSTPDTGFVVKWLAPVWRLLDQSNVPGKEKILKPLYQFLIQGGEALKAGGIHTPNHRWVVCSALAELYKIKKDEGYPERAERWLMEGIDIDADGQYEEKSSYIYSSLSDRVLISIARGFDMPELLDHVRKNLEMNFYYLHPNGEIVTEASGRQDNSIIGTLENYYYPYRYLALEDGNPQFAAACKLIEETAFAKTTGFLYYFLEDPDLWRELPAPKPLPDNYARTFENSSLTRIRRGNYDASILGGSTVFFTFHKKEVVLQGIRMASAFFGKGQFAADSMTEDNGKYVLTSYLEGPYYQPFPEDRIPGDGDWAKMPRSERPTSEVQQLTSTVTITESEKGFLLEIDIRGTDHVPLAVELIFRPGGTFAGTVPHEELEDVVFLKDGKGKYSTGNSAIHFGPGLHRHSWVQIRGGLPKMDAPTAYLTGFTPFHHQIQID
ncbi:hypothetical protein SAMN04488057_103232 [Cyclobacterium lianum]|uniref:Heparinase II/III-like protein n=1 Tax=Cyclobacterium lianum TaxID=388280 RepID=A0A1M7LCQ1_9BACT|nr:hypothetical protein [Cyclobacterium lianum]SHM75930.1 hypothetical protein SAMN04488057_103232 [Cyclobacterium lianum]